MSKNIVIEVCLLFCGLIVLIWVGYLCHFGIDITDEGFHLVSIANPLSYLDTISQFGLLYYPVYQLLGGDLVLFRLFNIFFIVCLSYSLFFRCLNFSSEGNYRIGIISTSFCLSLSALLFLSIWQPTPSYNTLNLTLLLLLAHVLLSFDKHTESHAALWISIGIIGALLSVIKATTALVTGLIFFFYVIASKKLRWRDLMLAVFSALMVISMVAIVMDGSILDYVERIQTGINNGNVLLGEHWALSNIVWHGKLKIQAPLQILILSLTFLILVTSLLYSNASRGPEKIGKGVLLIFVLYGSGVVIDVFSNPLDGVKATSRIYLVLSIPLAGMILCFINHFMSTEKVDKGASIWLIISICLLPYAFAIGTYSNYFYAILKSGVFFIATITLLLCKQNLFKVCYRQILVLSLSAVLVLTLLIDKSIDAPHRQPAERLSFNSSISGFDVYGGRLRLPMRTLDYLSSIKHLAQKKGFQYGDGMIDLTGASPGSLMAIGATNVASAWMIGGYSGSELRAMIALRNTPVDVVKLAWVLTEPGGHRSINASVLKSAWLDLENDYILVGSITTPKGLGGRPEAIIQWLYKPKRNAEMNRKTSLRSSP